MTSAPLAAAVAGSAPVAVAGVQHDREEVLVRPGQQEGAMVHAAAGVPVVVEVVVDHGISWAVAHTIHRRLPTPLPPVVEQGESTEALAA